jgi:hypothetical protein
MMKSIIYLFFGFLQIISETFLVTGSGKYMEFIINCKYCYYNFKCEHCDDNDSDKFYFNLLTTIVITVMLSVIMTFALFMVFSETTYGNIDDNRYID